VTTDVHAPSLDLPVAPLDLDFLSRSRAETEQGRSQWSSRLAALRRPCGYFILSRLAILFAALAGKWVYPKLNPLRALTSGWDGRWYTLIAQHGYPARLYNEGQGSRWAFFPALPAAIRGTVEVTGLTYEHASLLIAFVFGLTSTVAIWLAVREIFGAVVADRTVLLYVFFPASYVLSMTYTEGLFLTAAAACLFSLTRRYWVTAALFAVLGSLTKNFGAVLILCVVVATVPVILRDRKLRPLFALAISPLGLMAWLAYSWRRVGTPFAFVKAERLWDGSHFIWFQVPFLALVHLFSGLHAFTEGGSVLAAAALVFMFIGGVLLARAHDVGIAIPTCWWVFTIGGVLAALSPYEPNSVLRYSLAVFPLFAAVAWKMRPTWEGPVVGILAFSQGILVLMILVGTMHPFTWSLWP